MLLGYLLTGSTLYIFYGSTTIALVKFIIRPRSILAIITPPGSARKTVLVDIDYINYNLFSFVYVIEVIVRTIVHITFNNS